MLLVKVGHGVSLPSLSGAKVIGNFICVQGKDYTICRPIGSGSSAKCFEVKPIKGGDSLCIKIWNEKYRARLPDEAHFFTWTKVASCRLNEFVVLSELYKTPRRGNVLLMERGTSVNHRPPLDIDSYWAWLKKVLAIALEELIAPVDISPANIIVFGGGVLRLTDVEDYRILGVGSEVRAYGTYACETTEETDAAAILNSVYATLVCLHFVEQAGYDFERYYHKTSKGRHWNRLMADMKDNGSRAIEILEALSMTIVTSYGTMDFREDVIDILRG